MSQDASKLVLLKQMLENAEASLRSAKQILADMGVTIETAKVDRGEFIKKAKELTGGSDPSVIEGVFDGQGMMGPDKRVYPVPANYASKSKLIPGDVLKLTIKDDGMFLYKQIGPVERIHLVGILTNNDGQYQVIVKEKAYKVLLASVTYFHAEFGDRVTIIVPAKGESEWACIENVLPKEA